MKNPLVFLNKQVGSFNIRGIFLEPTYWQVGAIFFLLFLLIFTLARLRHMYVYWSVHKASLSFILYGFLLALILEGFMLIGGRTLFTEIIGLKNVPKPISTFLDIGRERLTKVLGAETQISKSSVKEKPNLESLLEDYQGISGEEKKEFKSIICKP